MLQTCIWKAHYSHIVILLVLKLVLFRLRSHLIAASIYETGDEAIIIRYRHRGASVERFENRLPAQADLFYL